MAPERLQTYGDWVALIGSADRCDSRTCELLMDGTFEESASGRVFTLVQEYCERCLNRLKDGLVESLQNVDPGDIDGAEMAVRRFSVACQRLLFFEDVKGLPAQSAELAREVRRYVGSVFAQLRNNYEKMGSAPADDMAYQMAKLERKWMAD